MPDEIGNLARIADALGVPVSSFYDDGAGCRADNRLVRLKTASSLSHVRAHLHRSDPADRRTFVAARLAITHAFSRNR